MIKHQTYKLHELLFVFLSFTAGCWRFGLRLESRLQLFIGKTPVPGCVGLRLRRVKLRPSCVISPEIGEKSQISSSYIIIFHVQVNYDKSCLRMSISVAFCPCRQFVTCQYSWVEERQWRTDRPFGWRPLFPSSFAAPCSEVSFSTQVATNRLVFGHKSWRFCSWLPCFFQCVFKCLVLILHQTLWRDVKALQLLHLSWLLESLSVNTATMTLSAHLIWFHQSITRSSRVISWIYNDAYRTTKKYEQLWQAPESSVSTKCNMTLHLSRCLTVFSPLQIRVVSFKNNAPMTRITANPMTSRLYW